MEYDKELIEQSIAKQYHILPSQQMDLKFSDWVKLVSGLMDNTPLIRVVHIRMEKDRNVIKKFNAEQRKLRNDWAAFKASKLRSTNTNSKVIDWDKQITALQNSLSKMFKKGKKAGEKT